MAAVPDNPRTDIMDLPQEILLEIIKNFATPVSRSDLYNLCLVKPFNPAATEALYGYGHSCNNSIEFLRTVIANPGLAALVRKLDLTPFSCNDAVNWGPLMEDDRSRFVNAMKALRPQGADTEMVRFEHALLKDCGTALCMLLWLYAPNISNICVFDPCFEHLERGHLQWWQAVLELSQLMRPAQIYQKLTHISIAHVEFKLGFLANILKLPSLRSLEILGSQRNQSFLWDSTADELPEDTSSVQSVRFSGHFLHPNVLELLIKCFKALRYFEYSQSYNSSNAWGVDEELMDFCTLGQALQKHCNSLRTLAIYNTGATNPWSFSGCIPISLLGCHKLEKVNLDARMLFAPSHPKSLQDVLPTSITSFLLQNVPGPDFNHVAALVSKLKERLVFPKIEYIGFQVLPADWYKHGYREKEWHYYEFDHDSFGAVGFYCQKFRSYRRELESTMKRWHKEGCMA
ncbi:hypothetical protein TW65_05388 [Stemphylium lycopersici]|nr:hypothetical protein TW65_05388 [Stemphylium lycopersici]